MVCQVHVVSAPCRYFRKLGDVDLRARLPTTTRVPDMGPGRGGTMKPSSFSSYLYEFATSGSHLRVGVTVQPGSNME